jgi:uncharacterized protein
VADSESNKAVGTVTTSISFKVTKDRMCVYLSCDSNTLRLSGLYDQIAQQLAGRGIVFTPDREAFEQMRTRALAMETPEVTDFLLVRGEEAVEPQDGRPDWSRDYFNTHYPVDPKTGEIDFKNRVGNPSVEAGDLVVKVKRAVPGRPGRDLYGNVISVRDPVDVRLVPSANVKLDEEAGGYRAVRAGRVSYRDNMLRIDPLLQIHGSLSSAGGNIAHNGSVFIMGDVDAGYTVQATEDVEIRGMVYEATIRCGGNLAIFGGVNGNSCASLDVQGDLHAKFILNSTVCSRGNIVVEKEIYLSNVETSGEVHVPSGRIVGGQIVATRGIVVGEGGSVSHPRTILAVKPDREMLLSIQKLKKVVAESNEQLSASRQSLREYKKQEAYLSDAGKRKMAEIATEVTRLQEWVTTCIRQIQGIIGQIEADQNATIRIERKIHPGVWFKIHHGDLRIDTELLGPIEARLDREKGEVALDGLAGE